jgi:hypothetical protein
VLCLDSVLTFTLQLESSTYSTEKGGEKGKQSRTCVFNMSSLVERSLCILQERMDNASLQDNVKEKEKELRKVTVWRGVGGKLICSISFKGNWIFSPFTTNDYRNGSKLYKKLKRLVTKRDLGCRMAHLILILCL